MSKIKDYWNNLYSRKNKNQEDLELERLRELKRKRKNINIKDSWNDYHNIDNNEELYRFREKKTNVYAIIFYISLSFFILAIGFTFLIFSLNKNKTPEAELKISLTAPPIVNSGEEMDYELTFDNVTKYKIEDLKVLIKYPDEVFDYDLDFSVNKDEAKIKEIKPGQEKSIKKRISLVGDTGEKKKIELFVTYYVEGYSIDFSKKKEFIVKIASSPVFVKINLPKKVKNGDEFDMIIDVSSNINKDLKNLVLIGRFPNGFQNIDTNPDPFYATEHKNIFKIPLLKVGEHKKIIIRTKVKGENMEKKVVQFIAGNTIDTSNYELKTKFFEAEEEISIKKPNFGVKFACSGVKEMPDGTWVVSAEDKIDCEMDVKNNLTDKMTNLDFSVRYSENPPFYIPSIKVVKGYFDSNKRMIIWNKFTDALMKSLKSYAEKEFHFSFKTKKLKDLAGYVKNPEFDLDFNFKASSFDDDAVGDGNSKNGEVEYQIRKDVKLKTNVFLETLTNYYDDDLVNDGGPKPIVGNPVKYTVQWRIYNTTNRVKDVVVSGKLPVGVELTNNFFPKNSYVHYNKNTRELKWFVKKIEPYIGYRTDPKTLKIQVVYTPVVSEVGGHKILIFDQKVVAKDEFTGVVVSDTGKDSKTDMNGDPNVSFQDGLVGE